LTYTGIKTTAQLEDPLLIKYLKEFILDRLVEKDTDTTYCITRSGQAEIYAAKASDMMRRITLSRIKEAPADVKIDQALMNRLIQELGQSPEAKIMWLRTLGIEPHIDKPHAKSP